MKPVKRIDDCSFKSNKTSSSFASNIINVTVKINKEKHEYKSESDKVIKIEEVQNDDPFSEAMLEHEEVNIKDEDG